MPIDKTFNKEKYKHASHVADLMDGYVMYSPVFICDSIPRPDPGKLEFTYWIGSPDDRSAGIFEGHYSPFFDTLDELDTFCWGARREYETIANIGDMLPESASGRMFWEEPISDRTPPMADSIAIQETGSEAERKLNAALEHIKDAEKRLLVAEDRFREQGRGDASAACARARAELMPVREILRGHS